jgi:hypothetical protein
MIIAA